MSESTVETPGEWLTVSQAAAALGISEKTLRKRIHAGEVKGEKAALEGGGMAWRVYLEGDRAGSVPEAERNFTVPRAGSAPEVFHSQKERNGSETVNAPEVAPEVTGTRAGSVPEATATAQDVQLARIEGYAARDMERAIGDAVTQAIAPLAAMMQTMNETNAQLLKEVAETRAEIEVMRADKDSDRAQLAAMEAMLEAAETSAARMGESTVEFDRTSSSAQNAPDVANSGAGGNVAGDAGNVAQRGTDARRGVLGRLIGWVNGCAR